MAAPTEAGLGLGVHEGEGVQELDKGAHGLGLSAEDPIGFDEKNGEEDEEVPVAKKARVEKADNGQEEGDEAGYGVEGLADKDVDETELDPLLGHDNGAAESPVEGEGEDEEDEENGGAGEEDEDEDESAEVDAVAGKDAPGNAGLRTLLQEGDATKTGGLLNGTDAETHTLNGAK
jgi:hypothetical protein